jgi:hypothetical protein
MGWAGPINSPSGGRATGRPPKSFLIWAELCWAGPDGIEGTSSSRPAGPPETESDAVAFAAAFGPGPLPERRRAPSRPLPRQGGPRPLARRHMHRRRSRRGLQRPQPPP